MGRRTTNRHWHTLLSRKRGHNHEHLARHPNPSGHIDSHRRHHTMGIGRKIKSLEDNACIAEEALSGT